MKYNQQTLGKYYYQQTLRQNTVGWFTDKLIFDFIRSSRNIKKYSNRFREIDTFCLFIGPPRSGTSLVGSFLDAHPNMVISHELDILKYFKWGISPKRIFALIISNSQRKATEGRKGGGYNNEVKNGWQGHFDSLKVLGDKKAALTAMSLGKNPAFIKKIRKNLVPELKFIYTVRNPFDTITTMSLKGGLSIFYAIENYFIISKCVEIIRKNVSSNNFFALKLEDLIANPEKVLKDLCSFLIQDVSHDYIQACSKLLFSSPKKTRTKGDWNEENISIVNRYIHNNDFLRGYSYSE